ncbi:MAG: hypothetical protein ISS16_07140 [Ignavibacteria bacterium]|nr:hypothetical protein [Ignavibacteria bacterium]
MENNNIKRLFDNFASRTVLTTITVVAAFITIFAFLKDKEVDLCYEIISNTNVLDFNADISKLEVIYDSTNLKKTQENLRIYTVKIVNNGNKDILKEYYDENDPIGIKLSSGKIIEKPELIQTSSDYLNRNVIVIDYQKDKITFSQVILESGEFFTIKLLVLHKQDTIPNLLSFGKVAGQKEINVFNIIDVKKDISFWERIYQGNFWIQIMRLVSYFLVVVIIVILIVIISDKIDSIKEKNRKTKMIKNFKNTESYEYTRMDDAIFDRYIKSGSRSFRQMQSLLESEEKLNETYNKLKEKIKSKEFRRYRRIKDARIRFHVEHDTWSIITEMINDGIIFKDQDKLSINQAMKDTLNKFVAFLDENGEFNMKYYSNRGEIILPNKEEFDIIETE